MMRKLLSSTVSCSQSQYGKVINGRPLQVPLVISTAAWKVVTGLKNRKSGQPSAKSPDSGDSESNGSKPEPVTLSWRNVTCSLSDSKSGANRELLSLDGGCATPGRLLAIMGPSGSGALLTSAPLTSVLLTPALLTPALLPIQWTSRYRMILPECHPSLPLCMSDVQQG